MKANSENQVFESAPIEISAGEIEVVRKCLEVYMLIPKDQLDEIQKRAPSEHDPKLVKEWLEIEPNGRLKHVNALLWRIQTHTKKFSWIAE